MSPMQQVRAKKSLGQHFLNAPEIARKIAESLKEFQLPILEVGPGMGILTQYLLDLYPSVKVVEIDTESVAYLQEHFFHLGKDNIISGDFLRLDLSQLFSKGEEFLLIGNYPYNISTQIFFHLLDYRHLIPAAGGMLQREVARRLASPPGSKEYGILSVFLQAWYHVEYLFSVPPELFSPPPKVHSGVIRLRRNDRQELGCDEALFRNVVKTTFNRRRKTIRNSIRPLLPSDSSQQFPPEAEPMLNLRPEQLSVDEFVILTNFVAEILNNPK